MLCCLLNSLLREREVLFTCEQDYCGRVAVDETVFAELSSVEGIFFVIKESHDNDGKFYVALAVVFIPDASIALISLPYIQI